LREEDRKYRVDHLGTDVAQQAYQADDDRAARERGRRGDRRRGRRGDRERGDRGIYLLVSLSSFLPISLSPHLAFPLLTTFPIHLSVSFGIKDQEPDASIWILPTRALATRTFAGYQR
jgi:hypothetical protein